MIKIMPHISEKSVLMAKTEWFTLSVPLGLSSTQVKALLQTKFKLSVIDIRTITKKTIVRKRAAKLISERGQKKAIVKLKDNQIFPGFESYLVEPKKEKASKKAIKTKTEKQEKENVKNS